MKQKEAEDKMRQEKGEPRAYESVIGLEVHMELSTKRKLFCDCPVTFGAAPNSCICPVCMGLPGALPVPNQQAVSYAVALGLATHCSFAEQVAFDRKNYFYPDNPQNYQITQFYEPICQNGFLTIETEQGEKTIGIREIHLEEDAGKLLHGDDGETLVDYNRAGVPLLELVTEPDLSDGKEAASFVEELRRILLYLGISDGKLQEGSLRVDLNLSLRKVGDKELGTRTETKNLNSFRFIQQAAAYEAKRQEKLLLEGQEVELETRRWGEAEGKTLRMRGKEESRDYRYFPEPDLVPFLLPQELVENVKGKLPELPDEKKKRYQEKLGLSAYDANLLLEEPARSALFEETLQFHNRPKQVANWLNGEGLRLRRIAAEEARPVELEAESFGKLLQLLEQGEITGTVAKELFGRLFFQRMDPERYCKEKGLLGLKKGPELQKLLEEVLAEHPETVTEYKNGKGKAMGFLVGCVMKKAKGRVDAQALPGQLDALIFQEQGN